MNVWCSHESPNNPMVLQWNVTVNTDGTTRLQSISSFVQHTTAANVCAQMTYFTCTYD